MPKTKTKAKAKAAKKVTKNKLCESCGETLDISIVGRAAKWCLGCRDKERRKYRSDYQRARWRARHPKTDFRVDQQGNRLLSIGDLSVLTGHSKNYFYCRKYNGARTLEFVSLKPPLTTEENYRKWLSSKDDGDHAE